MTLFLVKVKILFLTPLGTSKTIFALYMDQPLGTVDKDRNGKAPADFWVVKKATSTIQNSGNFDGWRRHEIGWVKWNVDAS
jgi:hypothetical protein